MTEQVQLSGTANADFNNSTSEVSKTSEVLYTNKKALTGKKELLKTKRENYFPPTTKVIP